MSVPASSKVTNKKVTPVSKPANLSANLTPGFYTAFSARATQKKSVNDNNQKEEQHSLSLENEAAKGNEIKEPEIFKILNTYHFDDFFQLAKCKDGSQLKMIILKRREARGVNTALPFSSAQNNHNEYISRAKDQYLNANWLMEDKPGMSFSGTL